MIEMSRSPESDMCRVRGIGVAESASTSTSSRSARSSSFCCDAEALLLVDDHEPELLRDHVARQDPVRADEHVDLAFGELEEYRLDLGRRRKRDTISTRIGKSR